MNRPELVRRSGAAKPADALSPGRVDARNPLAFAVSVGGETFGLPIEVVQTVFRLEAVTPVPLSPPHIVGLVNLRGKVLTAVCLRCRLDMPARPIEDVPFAVCIKYGAEDFALVVDSVHDVVELDDAQRIATPAHVTEHRARLTSAIYDHGNHILPLLDMQRLVQDTATPMSPSHHAA